MLSFEKNGFVSFLSAVVGAELLAEKPSFTWLVRLRGLEYVTYYMPKSGSAEVADKTASN